MALIGDIRKRSGLLIVIVGVALAAFVLGDFLSPGGRQQRTFNVGEVEGEDIPLQTFSQRLDENMNRQRQNLGRDNLTPQEQYNLRQSTWDDMVREILLGRQYNHLGLNISSEELETLILGSDPHSFIRQSFTDPQTGTFDPSVVQNFLSNFDQVESATRQRYLFIEQAIKDDHLQTKHRDLINKGFFVPDALVKRDFLAKNRQANVLALALRYDLIPDEEVAVSEQELRQHYDRNKFRYTQDEGRSVDYVIFDVQPSEDDREKIAEDFQKLYQEFQQVQDVPIFVNSVSDRRYDSSWFRRDQLSPRIEAALFDAPVGTIISPFVEDGRHIMARLMNAESRPDSLQASHILVSYMETGLDPEITRNKEQAERLSDSLYNVIRRDRRKFTEFARTFSDDPSAAQNDGDLGWFADGAMVYPFNQAVVEGRVGQIVQVETQFGYHIIEITGKTQPERKVQVAIVERFIEPSTRTVQETYVRASQFASDSRNAAAFEKAIAEQGLAKRTAGDVKPMDNNIPGISAPRELIRWMYNEARKVGDVSPAFDTDGSFVVATLTNIQNEGIMPFERARGMIEPIVRREKKAEILASRLREAAGEATDIFAIAGKVEAEVEPMENLVLNSTFLPNFGREPKLVGKIFAMEENQLSEPIAGENGVYMVKVEEFNEREISQDDFNSIRRVLSNNFRSRAIRESLSALKDNAKIEDNRLMVF